MRQLLGALDAVDDERVGVGGVGGVDGGERRGEAVHACQPGTPAGATAQYPSRNITLTRGPASLHLGTECCQVRWQVPPSMSRSPARVS